MWVSHLAQAVDEHLDGVVSTMPTTRTKGTTHGRGHRLMARIEWAHGAPGPVNDGERRVIEHLSVTLPDTFELYPNRQFIVGRNEPIECDIVIIGPDCVWVIETKDLAGRVRFGEHEFCVNDEPRRDPIAVTRLKAQKLANRLRVDPELGGVWVQHLVVLAREPLSLSIDPKLTSFVASTNRAAAIIEDPTLIGLKRGKVGANEAERVRRRLAVDGSARRPRAVFGQYQTVELLSQAGDRTWWSARHSMMGNNVLLEVVAMDPLDDEAIRRRRRSEAIRAAKVGQQVGAHPYLSTPVTAFDADDGSIVVVHPAETMSTLADLADKVNDWSDEVRTKILHRIASAVSACHQRGVSHRTIGTGNVYASPTGNARLGGFSWAGLREPTGTTATVAPADWSALGTDFWQSPEHLRGGVGPEADLFALGRLIEYLWPDGAPEALADAARTLTVEAPDARVPTAAHLMRMTAVKAAVSTTTVGSAALAPNVPFGQYRLIEKLGAGASGSVWRAVDTHFDNQVAIKVYDGADAGDEIQREFTALIEQNHPGVVRVRTGTKVGNRWALVSDFLDGPTLRDAIPPASDPRSLEESVSIGLQVLATLKAIHPDMEAIRAIVDDGDPDDAKAAELERLRDKGIAHRDIKPENIILVGGTRPVLVDFGLAAAGEIGTPGGTPQYRPPGVPFDHADPDLDLFAVGVVLHEMLTGEHPYTESDPISGTLDVDPTLDHGMRAVLERACSPRYDERFRSAEEFIAALTGLGLDEVEIAPPPMDVVERRHDIQTAIHEQRWDDALALCPDAWTVMRDRIEANRAAAAPPADEAILLEIDGYTLSFRGTHRFELAQSPASLDVGPGTVREYLVQGPDGEMLEVLDKVADTGERWVQGGETFQTPMPLARIGRALRMSFNKVEPGLMAELRQARIVNPELWSNPKKASFEELDAGAGVDVGDTLIRFGALAIGTRGEVLGETNKQRTFPCVVLPADSEHGPAVAHFLTKVMPLANRVMA
jgi:serine/threonine protein kinase